MRDGDLKRSVFAGIIAGVVFMILEMIMVTLFLGGSAWSPPRMIAAIIMGSEVLPPPATFNFGIFIVALMLHMVLSIVYTIVIGLIIRNLNLTMAMLIGAALGFLLYLINFFVFTGLFPWFADARNWVSAFAHIVFGFTAAWAYIGLVRSHISDRAT